MTYEARGTGFKSQLGHWLLLLKWFPLVLPGKCLDSTLKGHNIFVPNPFKFIAGHPPILSSAKYPLQLQDC